MEVIARQSKKALSFMVFMMVVGIFLIIAGALLLLVLINSHAFSTDDKEEIFVYIFCVSVPFGLGLFIVIAGGILMKKKVNTPEELIVYDNGLLIFADGYTCKPSDIVNVEYQRAVFAGPTNSLIMPRTSIQDYGKLKVYTKEKTIEYIQVEQVENAHNRLLYYMRQSRQP